MVVSLFFVVVVVIVWLWSSLTGFKFQLVGAWSVKTSVITKHCQYDLESKYSLKTQHSFLFLRTVLFGLNSQLYLG